MTTFDRIITCPRCSGGVVTVNADGDPTGYTVGPTALECATAMLALGERIGTCPTCEGAKQVSAQITVLKPGRELPQRPAPNPTRSHTRKDG